MSAWPSTSLQEVAHLATQKGLMSEKHFSVDGTLLQAWALQKSFRPKDGPSDGGEQPLSPAEAAGCGSGTVRALAGEVRLEGTKSPDNRVGKARKVR